jgi:YidC/Oxa1 family membrane protein insertase
MFTTILVQPLFNILFAIYAVIPGHDFGVAVIILTVLVRIILWPLVSRQLHSQKLMQQLQPEVAKIRKQAGGDRQKETTLLMELYKERGTSPLAPLLPLLVQFPIFIALYIVLKDSVHVDQITHLSYGFVAQMAPVANLIHHHASFSPKLFGTIDLTKPSWILALTAGLAQYYQGRQLQPQTLAAGGDQAQLMKGMTIIFPVVTALIGLRLPAALALYWTVTSGVASFQQYWVLLRDAHEMETEEDIIEGVVVDRSQPSPTLGAGKKAIAAKSAGGNRKHGGRKGAK